MIRAATLCSNGDESFVSEATRPFREGSGWRGGGSWCVVKWLDDAIPELLACMEDDR
jgi:hypothetical protein